MNIQKFHKVRKSSSEIRKRIFYCEDVAYSLDNRQFPRCSFCMFDTLVSIYAKIYYYVYVKMLYTCYFVPFKHSMSLTIYFWGQINNTEFNPNN